VNVHDIGFVFEIWEFAGISIIKSPLYADQDQDDEDGGVAVNVEHAC